MRIHAIETSHRLAPDTPRDGWHTQDGNDTPGTALVPAYAGHSAAPQRRLSAQRGRPDAAFLAHLIAVKLDVAQTRQRRRAEASTGAMSYATVGVPRQSRSSSNWSVSY